MHASAHQLRRIARLCTILGIAALAIASFFIGGKTAYMAGPTPGPDRQGSTRWAVDLVPAPQMRNSGPAVGGPNLSGPSGCPPPGTQVGGSLELALTSDASSPVQNGQTINFTITLKNNTSACTNNNGVITRDIIVTAKTPNANGAPVDQVLAGGLNLSIGQTAVFKFSYTVNLNSNVTSFTVSAGAVGDCPGYWCTPHNNSSLRFQVQSPSPTTTPTIPPSNQTPPAPTVPAGHNPSNPTNTPPHAVTPASSTTPAAAIPRTGSTPPVLIPTTGGVLPGLLEGDTLIFIILGIALLVIGLILQNAWPDERRRRMHR